MNYGVKVFRARVDLIPPRDIDRNHRISFARHFPCRFCGTRPTLYRPSGVVK